MLLLGWGWAILSPPCSLFIPEAYALGQRKESRRAGREGLAWREKGPAPSLTRSYSRSGRKGVSPDLGVRGSGSSGAKPRGASGSRATSLVYPSSWRGGGGCRCVWVSVSVSPATQLSSQGEEAGGGEEKECLQGAPCSSLLPRASEGKGWA